ncbi:DUF3152 domain-containing protein [Streptomyces sp. V4-01]|uniref:DUF3152 domain-containing protein n=1 Tax=Actinacidiphila polyblastidii TaxID=3110430 RepID=A0ABU7PKB4_9ACTN|nr:DUF3152 domain-containing protein [Streptomyces sp. V4-01]
MGRHSARDGQDGRDNPVAGGAPLPPALPSGAGAGTGRRRRGGAAEDTGGFAVIGPRDLAARGQEHPEHREHGAWGGSGGWSGQVMGRPGRSAGAHGSALDPVEEWAEDWAPYDTAELMAPTRDGATGGPGRQQPRSGGPGGGRTVPRPRQEFVDAFDAPAPARPPRAVTAVRGGGAQQHGDGSGGSDGDGGDGGGSGGSAAGARPGRGGGKGRTLSGIAAAAVVTVLAVVVGGQVASEKQHTAKGAGAGTDADGVPRAATGEASRSQQRTQATGAPTASAAATPAPTYDQLMAEQFPLDPKLSLSGAFVTVPGHQAAPGRGKVMRVRVDVEKGLPLDPLLFSDTVFKTLNDPRSWGHGGAMTFERVSTGPADVVVTLASPGTTARWCAKSGLDTSVENVSCDSASTPRTMINAYRWAQGAATYGPRLMHAYRQMLINHEVGHRLGHDHVGCPKAGAPAPVMMQQTKFLSLDGGPTCKPNAWPFP